MAGELATLAVRPGADPVAIRRSLARFVGKLRIHAAMETDALYPSLLEHEDPRVRAKAERLHEELGPLYGLVDDFQARWRDAEAIARHRVRFRIELARVLAKLGWRMRKENLELYPMADGLG